MDIIETYNQIAEKARELGNKDMWEFTINRRLSQKDLAEILVQRIDFHVEKMLMLAAVNIDQSVAAGKRI